MALEVRLDSKQIENSPVKAEQSSKWRGREVKKAAGGTAVALSILGVVGAALFKTAPLWALFVIASGPIGWAIAAAVTVGFVVAVGMISLVASDVFAGNVAGQSEKNEIQAESVKEEVQSESKESKKEIVQVSGMRVDENSPRGAGTGRELDVIREELVPGQKMRLQEILSEMIEGRTRLLELELQGSDRFEIELNVYNEWTEKMKGEFPVISKLQDFGSRRVQRAEEARALDLNDEDIISFNHEDREVKALEFAIDILNSFEDKEEEFNLLKLSDNRPENVRSVKPQDETELSSSPE